MEETETSSDEEEDEDEDESSEEEDEDHKPCVALSREAIYKAWFPHIIICNSMNFLTYEKLPL